MECGEAALACVCLVKRRSPVLLCGVEPALRAGSTPHNKLFAWRSRASTRREGEEAGKLGQICTGFEVKHRKSARIVGIDHPQSGKTAPHLISSVNIL